MMLGVIGLLCEGGFFLLEMCRYVILLVERWIVFMLFFLERIMVCCSFWCLGEFSYLCVKWLMVFCGLLCGKVLFGLIYCLCWRLLVLFL